MRVLILGFGLTGRAVADYLTKKEIEWTAVENDQEIGFKGIDLVVKSPGVPPTHRWILSAKERNLQVVSEVELALQHCRHKTLYAITGSNGKTTTTLLTAHLLGEKAIAVGNVGKPLISQIESKAEIFVIELSSFQLEDLPLRPYFDAGVILNITPNHLDRYSSFESYARAKLRLQHCLKEGGQLYVGKDVYRTYGIGQRLKEKAGIGRVDLNLENCSAACALAQMHEQVSEKELAQKLQTFQKPSHRMEKVGKINGITYINDSKATSVDAVLNAIRMIDTSVILIAGGVDKGGVFRDWIPAFKDKVKIVFALGEAAERICRELSPEICVERVASLEEGVKRASKRAVALDTVLLSPGCSSFDQFKNYEHRGEKFKELVLGEKKL